MRTAGPTMTDPMAGPTESPCSTDHETDAATPVACPEGAPNPRRTRRFRKRTKFLHVPKAPWPVRSLWEAATEEERRRAHATCTAMLELWLGKATKREISERLQLPPLRLWQMSQQALAGMVAGLLKQPRRPPSGEPSGEPSMPERDWKKLKRENEDLSRQNEQLAGLIAILRDLPGNRESAAGAAAVRTSDARRTTGTNPPPAAKTRRTKKAVGGRAPGHRELHPKLAEPTVAG